MKKLAIQALRQIESSARKGIWDAHRGCSVIAGTLLLHDKLIDDGAALMIEAQIREVLDFQIEHPNPETGMSLSTFASRLLKELGVSAMEPREIGHDVIYSAYVLRALETFEIDPWNSLLDGLVTLVRKVKSSGPGWITVNGVNERREVSETVGTTDANYWSRFRDFKRPLSMEVGDMQLGHLLTHGHAIEMLRAFGTESLIVKLDLAHRKRLFTLARANLDEQSSTPLRQLALDPRAEKYWGYVESFGDMHGHVFKYAYSLIDMHREGLSEQDLESFCRIIWPGQPASVFT